MASASQPPNSTKKDRPCDSCRRRKSRCVIDANESACVLCKFHKQDCTFLANPVARKRKATDSDDAQGNNAKRRLSSTSGKVKRSDGGSDRVIRTNHGPGVEEYDDLEGTSLLKKTLGLRNLHHSRYLGPTGDLEPSLQSNTDNVQNEVQLQRGILRRVSPSSAFILMPDPETQGYDNEISEVDAIEETVAPHGKALLTLYFRIVHPSFSILHKQVFLEKYGRSHREFSPPLLAAVYLLALQYWAFSDDLSELEKPDIARLERLARTTLQDTIHRPKLSTVQAGILLLQHTEGDSAELTAQMVSVGYNLGLHLDPTNWSIPDWEVRLRKRLGWSLYMQDKWSALGNGRPPLIASHNWDLVPLVTSDFPETHEDDEEGSSEVENGIIMHQRLIMLTEILTDLLETTFSARAQRDIRKSPDQLAAVLEKVKPIQIRLKEWYMTLPESLSMDSGSIMKLSSVGSLRLAYLATEMTLHRRILLTVSHSSPTNPLHDICRSAARARFLSALEFVKSLKPQHLKSFWYFVSASNFSLIATFGTLLCATTYVLEERKWYAAKLKEYRFLLKINSQNGAKYMKPAISVLDANQLLLAETETHMVLGTPESWHTQSGVSPQMATIQEPNTEMVQSPTGQYGLEGMKFDSNNVPDFSSSYFSSDVYGPFASEDGFTFESHHWNT